MLPGASCRLWASGREAAEATGRRGGASRATEEMRAGSESAVSRVAEARQCRAPAVLLGVGGIARRAGA